MTDTYQQPEHGWTCFHCGETFKKFGAARDHFGATLDETAGCQIKAGEERGLLMALRKCQMDYSDLLFKMQMEDSYAPTEDPDHARR